MKRGRGRRLVRWLLMTVPFVALSVGYDPPASATGVPMEMGTHWADPTDFATLRQLGYTFAIITVSEDPNEWAAVLEAAAREHIKLIIGMWPTPFHRRSSGTWRIDDEGVNFILFLKAHPQQVMAIWGFNEPYWTHPEEDTNYPCGNFSAKDLRRLRDAIRDLWSGAKIYHDLDSPSQWAPGGDHWKGNRFCIGSKYADQSGIADYAGIWSYPFDVSGAYRRDESLAYIEKELNFVKSKMAPAKPVVLGQAFASTPDGQRFPSAAELHDWSCALRDAGIEYVSWYAWRQASYPHDLSRHPSHWEATLPTDCFGRRRGGCVSPVEDGGVR